MRLRLPHTWTRTHRRETVKERALCEGYRALGDVRAWSRWLKKRPISDGYGYDRLGGGGSGASGWRSNDSWRDGANDR